MNDIRIICNTSPIIGLLSINRLSLLWELFETVLIPQAVYDELCSDSNTHQDDIQKIQDSINDGRIKVFQVKNQQMVKSMYGRLHYGEIEVIVGAKEQDVKLVVIDDLSARRMANEVMLDTIGVLGILQAAKNYGIISNIKDDIDRLMCLLTHSLKSFERLPVSSIALG